jgi:hypothetical protein
VLFVPAVDVGFHQQYDQYSFVEYHLFYGLTLPFQREEELDFVEVALLL